MRPADAVETVECWELALRRTDGPSALVLSRHASVIGLRTGSDELLEELAPAVVFLASDAAAAIHGAVYRVDNGKGAG